MGTLPRVVVTGIGAETALGHGVSALWEGALLGLSAIRPVTRFDTRRFHARQAALIDRERGPRLGQEPEKRPPAVEIGAKPMNEDDRRALTAPQPFAVDM